MSGRASLRDRARERLIFALDVSSLREAGRLVRLLEGSVGTFKVGKQLFLANGPRAITYLRERGAEVFLDLKFHDIPQTVARASVEATRLGVSMFNVHASGSTAMMRETQRQVRRVCRTEKLRRPRMLAVTVLTSLSSGDLETIGVHGQVEDQVVRLAVLAKEGGMDGVVASPQEIASIRHACGPRFLIVTPGIRRSDDAVGDQHRTSGPARAIEDGADYIVVGRPIRDAPDPRAEAELIVDEIAEALAARRSPRGRG
jgi:orotidine-5'-phosphate decarboxylase